MLPVVQLVDVKKRFGAVDAVRGVSIEVRAGEVVGVVGDNAAGKSTLMKIICGAVHPDEGEVRVLNEPVHLASPKDARRLGIEMVYQELALVEGLDVTQNIFLDREVRRRLLGIMPVLDRPSMDRLAKDVLGRLSIDIGSVHDLVGGLSGGQRQAIAIARAMAFTPRLVVMDEPTASLSVDKVHQVLKVIGRLRSEGVAVLLVTHRLADLFEVADRIVVLWEGIVVADLRREDTSVEQLLVLMTGGTVSGVASAAS